MNRPPRLTAIAAAAALLLAFAACTAPAGAEEPGRPAAPAGAESETAVATFAGGCFWCMEPPFDMLDGVLATTSGYTGGPEKNPTYKQVASGATGHAEAVRVTYDPARVTYERLLDVFWVNVDPTTDDRQFCDRGRQYRPAIFVHDDEQRRLAEASRAAIAETKTFDGPVKVEIVDAGAFWAAEEYHQDYATKNPIRYRFYRRGCGRDARLRELWGDAAGGH